MHGNSFLLGMAFQALITAGLITFNTGFVDPPHLISTVCFLSATALAFSWRN